MHPYQHPLFLQFIVYFNQNQDYFECHEVLEEYWKSYVGYNKEHPLTAFILLSTGMYHWRRNNYTGAGRTLNKSLARFQAILENKDAVYQNCIDIRLLISQIIHTIDCIQKEESFTAFELPITDRTLSDLALQEALHMHLLIKGSDPVIHKHMLRDRSDILRLREARLNDRKNNKT